MTACQAGPAAPPAPARPHRKQVAVDALALRVEVGGEAGQGAGRQQRQQQEGAHGGGAAAVGQGQAGAGVVQGTRAARVYRRGAGAMPARRTTRVATWPRISDLHRSRRPSTGRLGASPDALRRAERACKRRCREFIHRAPRRGPPRVCTPIRPFVGARGAPYSGRGAGGSAQRLITRALPPAALLAGPPRGCPPPSSDRGRRAVTGAGRRGGRRCAAGPLAGGCRH